MPRFRNQRSKKSEKFSVQLPIKGELLGYVRAESHNFGRPMINISLTCLPKVGKSSLLAQLGKDKEKAFVVVCMRLLVRHARNLSIQRPRNDTYLESTRVQSKESQ
jgi:hypothetical protein